MSLQPMDQFEDGDIITNEALNDIIDNIMTLDDTRAKVMFRNYRNERKFEGFKIAGGQTIKQRRVRSHRNVYTGGFFTPGSRPAGLVSVGCATISRWSTSVAATRGSSDLVNANGIRVQATNLAGRKLPHRLNWIMLGH